MFKTFDLVSDSNESVREWGVKMWTKISPVQKKDVSSGGGTNVLKISSISIVDILSLMCLSWLPGV